jgi:chromosome segregation ATPase
VRQQEVTALKAELEQTAAAAEAIAAQQLHDLQQLQDKHAAELARLDAQHKLHVQQQLQAALAEHYQQKQQLAADLQAQCWQELAPVHEALQVLRCQQQEAAARASSAQADCTQETSELTDSWQQQLQEVRSELAAVQADAQEVARLAAEQQDLLQELRQHQAKLAPQGLEALAQQAQEAVAARCAGPKLPVCAASGSSCAWTKEDVEAGQLSCLAAPCSDRHCVQPNNAGCHMLTGVL